MGKMERRFRGTQRGVEGAVGDLEERGKGDGVSAPVSRRKRGAVGEDESDRWGRGVRPGEEEKKNSGSGKILMGRIVGPDWTTPVQNSFSLFFSPFLYSFLFSYFLCIFCNMIQNYFKPTCTIFYNSAQQCKIVGNHFLIPKIEFGRKVCIYLLGFP
jgi:hypothetical protein